MVCEENLFTVGCDFSFWDQLIYQVFIEKLSLLFNIFNVCSLKSVLLLDSCFVISYHNASANLDLLSSDEIFNEATKSFCFAKVRAQCVFKNISDRQCLNHL